MKEQYIRKDTGLYLYPEVEEPKYLYPGDISSVVKYSREQKAYNKWKESRIPMSEELLAVTKEGDVLTEGKDFVIIGGQRKRNHDGSTTRAEKLAIIITKEAGEDYVASVPPQDETFVASHTASSGNSIEQWSELQYDDQELLLQRIVDEINTSSNLHSRHVIRKLIERK